MTFVPVVYDQAWLSVKGTAAQICLQKIKTFSRWFNVPQKPCQCVAAK